jgi:class 3 adenylate cyclase
VAVFFVDLRGFSRYTNVVSADDVVRILTDYYETGGAVLQRHGATVGGLDGDGMMAYVGDPVAREDAAPVALAMARDVAVALDARVGDWRAGDYTLGYGIGLSFGPATIGVMGFEGLYDYTAVGAVVNLASRLCGDAAHGEIVVDSSFKAAANLDGELRRRADVDLKGFGVTETFLVEH